MPLYIRLVLVCVLTGAGVQAWTASAPRASAAQVSTEACDGVANWLRDALGLWVTYPVDQQAVINAANSAVGDAFPPEAVETFHDAGTALTARSQATAALDT